MSEKDKEIEKPMEISDHALELMRLKSTENPNTLDFAHTVGSAVVKSIDTGKVKGRAVAAMHEQSTTQLKQIQEQVEVLLNQAKLIQDRVEVSERIYLSEMGFDPLIGKTYYLYRKKSGKDCLSMIGPDQWGKSFPFEKYVATVKLLSDHTWSIEESNDDGLQRT